MEILSLVLLLAHEFPQLPWKSVVLSIIVLHLCKRQVTSRYAKKLIILTCLFVKNKIEGIYAIQLGHPSYLEDSLLDILDKYSDLLLSPHQVIK